MTLLAAAGLVVQRARLVRPEALVILGSEVRAAAAAVVRLAAGLLVPVLPVARRAAEAGAVGLVRTARLALRVGSEAPVTSASSALRPRLRSPSSMSSTLPALRRGPRPALRRLRALWPTGRGRRAAAGLAGWRMLLKPLAEPAAVEAHAMRRGAWLPILELRSRSRFRRVALLLPAEPLRPVLTLAPSETPGPLRCLALT